MRVFASSMFTWAGLGPCQTLSAARSNKRLLQTRES